jgi:hypothetical protein
MHRKTIQRALTGVVVGTIGGPVVAGLVGFLTLSATWLVLGLIQGWSSQELAGIIPWAAVFGVLVAPIGASVGAIVGLVIGSLARWFGSSFNAGSFGGAVGSVIGLLVAPVLFGGTNELSPVVVAVLALAVAGVVVAVLVRRLVRRLGPT